MHKKDCKRRKAELRDEALFNDPPPKKDCLICCLPMPSRLLSCITLPDASVPINDFARANPILATHDMEEYYPCCGKTICKGCTYSFCESGNIKNCPYCKAENLGKTIEEKVEELMKRVEANDAGAISMLANYYCYGENGFRQDQTKAMELYARAADLGCSEARCHLADLYTQRGDLKKAKFHFEVAAMAGHEKSRYMLGIVEDKLDNMERAVKHWRIAASSGCFCAMHTLTTCLETEYISREAIDTTLAAYNISCAEMRSEARDAYIQCMID